MGECGGGGASKRGYMALERNKKKLQKKVTGIEEE